MWKDGRWYHFIPPLLAAESAHDDRWKACHQQGAGSWKSVCRPVPSNYVSLKMRRQKVDDTFVEIRNPQGNWRCERGQLGWEKEWRWYQKYSMKYTNHTESKLFWPSEISKTLKRGCSFKHLVSNHIGGNLNFHYIGIHCNHDPTNISGGDWQDIFSGNILSHIFLLLLGHGMYVSKIRPIVVRASEFGQIPADYVPATEEIW